MVVRMIISERPEDKIARLMRGTEVANSQHARTAGNVTHIRLGGQATYIGGDVIVGGTRDPWAESRAEQARCRRLTDEIDQELAELSATELQHVLTWIRRSVLHK